MLPSIRKGLLAGVCWLGLVAAASAQFIQGAPGASGSGGITVGTTTITSGTNTRVLFDNSGVVGEYSISGTGSVAMTASPTFTTPTLGVASATSINKVAFTAPATSATLTIADGKTLTSSNTITFTATDGSTVNFGAGGTLQAASALTDNYNNSGTVFCSICLTVSNTSWAAGTKLFSLIYNANAQFAIDPDGAVDIYAGSSNQLNFKLRGNSVITGGNGLVTIPNNTGVLAFGTGGGANAGIGKAGTNILEVNNGVNGTLASLRVKHLDMRNAYTIATLPTPSTGFMARVTDGDAGLAWGATAVNSGAGATSYELWYNGANWTVFGK